MTFPSVDIIVPVWNNLFETRACLAAILEHSPEARLIIVDNGSSRETELMLEEFSEPLGERGLFIKSERNIGLVPAINMGLARSDSDFAVVLRPHVLVSAGWLRTLLEDAESVNAGILSPRFTGKNGPALPKPVPGCTLIECCTVSLSVLLLRGEMRIMTGNFDEKLDGGEWCLKEYVRRVADKGYRTFVTSRSVVSCGEETSFGSVERRSELTNSSRVAYLARWGASRHYAVYFGKKAEAGSLNDAVEMILDGARQGHRFTLLLHRRQHSDFRRMGWNGLHAGIELYALSSLAPQRDLQKKLESLRKDSAEMLAVRGSDEAVFPGSTPAIFIGDLFDQITKHSTNCLSMDMEEPA
ncbi:MAG: glycosyltransferase [Geobacter sp.]|nr:glycosyltransferase [Geobacter sp.]